MIHRQIDIVRAAWSLLLLLLLRTNARQVNEHGLTWSLPFECNHAGMFDL
jgi:hypothetical protein